MPKEVFISPNSGRDVAGLINIGKKIDEKDYDICLVLHTKSSPQNTGEYVEKWSQDLLEPIVGKKSSVADVIESMRRDMDVWGAAASLQWKSVCMNNNLKHVSSLFQKYEISNDCKVIEYVSGTMMFLNVSVLKTLSDKLDFDDFETCTGKDADFFFDGQLEHAVERVIGAIIKQRNQKIMWVGRE